jgi:hypothetical protein
VGLPQYLADAPAAKMASLAPHLARTEPETREMRKNLIAAATLALVLAPCAAQAGDATVARLVGISGNVLVSNDFNIASAGERLRLVPGARVLVTANSSATVEFDDGCRVRLQGGERFEIRGTPACATRTHTGGAYVSVARTRP